MSIIMNNVRPGSNVMKQLGDCSKLKLDEIDLISRTLKCEIEIFHFDEKLSFTSIPYLNEAEEEIPVPTSREDATGDEDQIFESVRNLDCLIRRIEQMQLYVLKRKEEKLIEISKTKDVGEIIEMPPLSCEEQLEINNLVHDQQFMQCQIDNLVFCYQKIRSVISKTNFLMNQMENTTRRIHNMGDEYKQWADQTINEMSFCAERHRYLESKMISKDETKVVIKSHTLSAFKRGKKCVKRNTIVCELLLFDKEIKDLIQYSQDLRSEMDKRLAIIDKSVKLRNNKFARR